MLVLSSESDTHVYTHSPNTLTLTHVKYKKHIWLQVKAVQWKELHRNTTDIFLYKKKKLKYLFFERILEAANVDSFQCEPVFFLSSWHLVSAFC